MSTTRTPASVAVRVEAGGSIGVGHAMRCATLADALLRGGHSVTVVTDGLPDWVESRFDGAEIVSPVGDVGGRAAAGDVDVWIVDGYTLGDDLLSLAGAGVPVVAIDDNHELPVGSAQLVLNQNLHAGPELYPDVAPERLLLGSRYALVRPDVVELSRTRRSPQPGRALVSFGGTDPAGLTLPVARALSDLELVVALGADHPDRTSVDELRHVEFADAELIDALRTADIAVIGGGSTLWEVAVCGLPAVAVVVADNQVRGTAAAVAAGFVESVDARGGRPVVEQITAATRRLLSDRTRHAEMAAAGRSMFDGDGAERVAAAVAGLV